MHRPRPPRGRARPRRRRARQASSSRPAPSVWPVRLPANLRSTLPTIKALNDAMQIQDFTSQSKTTQRSIYEQLVSEYSQLPTDAKTTQLWVSGQIDKATYDTISNARSDIERVLERSRPTILASGILTPEEREAFKLQGRVTTAQALSGIFVGTLAGRSLGIANTSGKTVANTTAKTVDSAAGQGASKAMDAPGSGVNSGGKGAVADANFAQSRIRANETFSAEGAAKYTELAGRPINTVDDLASAISRGEIKLSQLPVDYVVTTDGTKLILNTRTSVALDRAGVPKTDWYGSNRTGVQVEGIPKGTTYDDLAQQQLKKIINCLLREHPIAKWG